MEGYISLSQLNILIPSLWENFGESSLSLISLQNSSLIQDLISTTNLAILVKIFFLGLEVGVLASLEVRTRGSLVSNNRKGRIGCSF